MGEDMRRADGYKVISETVYPVGGKKVTHEKGYARFKHTERGAFRTRATTVQYRIINTRGTKHILLGKTYKVRPILLIFGDESGVLHEAIRLVAEKEKAIVLQSSKKPDYGFQPLKAVPNIGPKTRVTNRTRSQAKFEAILNEPNRTLIQ